ncbi:tetratricopeptide repeat protein [Clostridium polynesiense]|uniref:tetratricopeptide repeat protein n=1 Tax=Clostridium polynesiense TaxID=1325933 RepID=UPI000A6FB5EC|nr:tetratricopeptide repeat protein [Clostridium polynesiense]
MVVEAMLNNTPSYLKEKVFNIKYNILIGVIILFISLVSPYLLLIFILFIIYTGYKYIKIKGYYGEQYNRALSLYNESAYELAVEVIDNLSIRYKLEDNLHIIKALSLFQTGNPEGFLKELSLIKTKELNNDLDILFKKAEAYTLLKDKDKALDIYNYLLKAFPNSGDIKERIISLN